MLYRATSVKCIIIGVLSLFMGGCLQSEEPVDDQSSEAEEVAAVQEVTPVLEETPVEEEAQYL